jgi:hypothetical protein
MKTCVEPQARLVEDFRLGSFGHPWEALVCPFGQELLDAVAAPRKKNYARPYLPPFTSLTLQTWPSTPELLARANPAVTASKS